MFTEMNDGADFHLNAEWKLLWCSYGETESLTQREMESVCVCACEVRVSDFSLLFENCLLPDSINLLLLLLL